MDLGATERIFSDSLRHACISSVGRATVRSNGTKHEPEPQKCRPLHRRTRCRWSRVRGGATITATVVGLNTGNLYIDGAVESVPHARGSYTASGNTIEWTVSAKTTRTGDVSGAVVQRTKFDNIRVKVKLTTSSIPGTGNFVIAGTNHHRFGVDVWTDLAGAEAMGYAWSNFGLAGKIQASGVGSSQTYSPTTWQTVSGKPDGD